MYKRGLWGNQIQAHARDFFRRAHASDRLTLMQFGPNFSFSCR